MKATDSPIADGFQSRFKYFLDYHSINANKLATILDDPARIKYGRYVRGEAKPNLETLELIARHFPSVSMDWLVKGEGEIISPDEPDLRSVQAKAARLEEENKDLRSTVALLKKVLKSYLPAEEEEGKKIEAAEVVNMQYPLSFLEECVKESGEIRLIDVSEARPMALPIWLNAFMTGVEGKA